MSKRRLRNYQQVIELTLSSLATSQEWSEKDFLRRLLQKSIYSVREYYRMVVEDTQEFVHHKRSNSITPKERRFGCTYCNSWCFGPSCELLHLSLEDLALVSLPKTLQWQTKWTGSGWKTKDSVQEKAPAAQVEHQNSSPTTLALLVSNPACCSPTLAHKLHVGRSIKCVKEKKNGSNTTKGKRGIARPFNPCNNLLAPEGTQQLEHFVTVGSATDSLLTWRPRSCLQASRSPQPGGTVTPFWVSFPRLPSGNHTRCLWPIKKWKTITGGVVDALFISPWVQIIELNKLISERTCSSCQSRWQCLFQPLLLPPIPEAPTGGWMNEHLPNLLWFCSITRSLLCILLDLSPSYLD